MVKVSCTLRRPVPTGYWRQRLIGTMYEERSVVISREEALRYRAEGWDVQVKLVSFKCWCRVTKQFQPVDAPCTAVQFDDALPIIRSEWP